ncbi:hypothetical protein IMZ31_06150 [Pontibacillus sp. ALD_SL1]|uniref:SunI/YnzG family protein n=1 Tax=Pontibacillus sp. ALD_SL1 TaxID=2777185 RepID=UPI001A97CD07|nr:hypothetical protein [Pontibacillus sp. ALD_SL1]QST01142.1 hypothetical protein IMZ31_06150 [Pontibacillus sp. ALD_SL1]
MTILWIGLGLLVFLMIVYFFQVRWKVKGDVLEVKHLFSRVTIPLHEIIKVEESEYFAGPGDAIIIGIPGRINDRLVLTTTSKKYLLALNGYGKFVRDLEQAKSDIQFNL